MNGYDRDSWELGFQAGFQTGLNMSRSKSKIKAVEMPLFDDMIEKKQKRKVKRSPKAKLLDKMTQPIWNKYKKGRGKKTYVQIRAQVSRSQKYKRAVKRL